MTVSRICRGAQIPGFLGCGEVIAETERCIHVVTGVGLGVLSHIHCVPKFPDGAVPFMATPVEFDKLIEKVSRSTAPDPVESFTTSEHGSHTSTKPSGS